MKTKAKSKGELREIANCCNVLGELYQQQGKFEDAISEHEVLSLNLSISILWVWGSECSVFFWFFFQEERKICKQLNDCIGIGIAHRKIGEALNELGQYENALKHQQKYFGNQLTKCLFNFFYCIIICV